MSPRLSAQTRQVLSEFLQDGRSWKYGYDSSRNTGLKSGTLYPILMRLAGHALLERRWEEPEPGRPPRHMYRLTTEGLRYAREHVLHSRRVLAPHPAFRGVKN